MKKTILITLLMFTTFVGFADKLVLTNLIVETSLIPNGGSGPYVRHGINTIAFSFHHDGLAANNLTYILTIDGTTIQRGAVVLNEQKDQTVTGLKGYTFTKGRTPVIISVIYDNNEKTDAATYTVTTPAELLPVQLNAFSGVSNKGKVSLSWSTSLESGFNYFSVQKSANGIDFLTIGAVKAIGSNSTYRYEIPSEGEAYFRLKLVDNDATFKFSPVIFVVTATSAYTTEYFDINGRKLPADSQKQGFMIIVKTASNGHRTMRKVFIQ